MQKHMICLLLSLLLVFSFGSYALAQGAAQNNQAVAISGPYYTINGVAVSDPSMCNIGGNTYVSMQTALAQVYSNVNISWAGNRATVVADGLTLEVGLGESYILANGRALQVPNRVQVINGRVLLPIRPLAQAMGGFVEWDAQSGTSALYSGSPIQSGNTYYNGDDLYWLSRIINAESGGEPLEGKLAVGTVVLSRVASPKFPNSVYGVVFERNNGVWQFTPVRSGAINRAPNEESIIAAKLCLEGVQVAKPSLYFVNQYVSPNSWASRNRPYVTTIGRHTFFA